MVPTRTCGRSSSLGGGSGRGRLEQARREWIVSDGREEERRCAQLGESLGDIAPHTARPGVRVGGLGCCSCRVCVSVSGVLFSVGVCVCVTC